MLPTGQLYIEDELTVNGEHRDKVTNDQFAAMVKARSEGTKRRVSGYYADPQMFKNQTGATIAESFAKARVQETADGSTGMHALRVTFGSMLDDAGTPQTIRNYLMGHSSGKVYDTYSRLELDRAREAPGP